MKFEKNQTRLICFVPDNAVYCKIDEKTALNVRTTNWKISGKEKKMLEKTKEVCCFDENGEKCV